MTPLVNFIQVTTYDLTPSADRLSPIFWTAFTTLNKVHGMWRWYRRMEVYRQPDNLIHLLAGHALNYFVGDLMLVRLAAQCLLVSTRLLDCVKQQAKIRRMGKRWIKCLQGGYVENRHLAWIKKGTSYLSPSSIHWWKMSGLTLFERIKSVVFCTMRLLKEIFTLSMNMMDVMDALSWSPTTRQDAFGEGFININKWINTVVENKEELLEGLRENKIIIKSFLKCSSITYEQLESGMEKTIQKAETISQSMQTISQYGNETVTRLGKQAVKGGLSVIGLRPH